MTLDRLTDEQVLEQIDAIKESLELMTSDGVNGGQFSKVGSTFELAGKAIERLSKVYGISTEQFEEFVNCMLLSWMIFIFKYEFNF